MEGSNRLHTLAVLPSRKQSLNQLNGRMGGLLSRCGRCGGNKISCPFRQFSLHPRLYTDCAVQARTTSITESIIIYNKEESIKATVRRTLRSKNKNWYWVTILLQKDGHLLLAKTCFCPARCSYCVIQTCTCGSPARCLYHQLRHTVYNCKLTKEKTPRIW